MMRKLFALIVLLALLTTAGGGYYAFRPLPLPATPFEFTLKQGSSLKGMARDMEQTGLLEQDWAFVWLARLLGKSGQLDRKSTRLNSSHQKISYAVFCLKKKK